MEVRRLRLIYTANSTIFGLTTSQLQKNRVQLQANYKKLTSNYKAAKINQIADLDRFFYE